MSDAHPEPKPFPLPPDFPVAWPNPEDLHKPWMYDRMHAPEPITPMTGWLAANPWSEGTARGFKNAGQPITLMCDRFNTYYFNAAVPTVPPEGMEEAGKHAEATLKALLPVFHERWENEWLPRVKAHHDFWSAFDLEAASDEELLAHMDDAFERYADLWDIHFHVGVGFLSGVSMFVDMYLDLFEGTSELDAYGLIKADHNISLEVGYQLWDLAQKYKDKSSVANPIRTKSTNAALSSFVGTEEGREFLAELRGLMDTYGHRSDGVIEISDPSWTEDPTPALTAIRENMAAGARDPRANHTEQIKERDAATAAARAKLVNHPDEVKGAFEMFLNAGREGSRIQEDHNFWIDQGGLHHLRHIFLAFGDRLAAKGVIAHRGDVFYLVPDTVRSGLLNGGDFKQQITDEKAEMEKWSSVVCPPFIGTDYGPPPDNPVGRAIGRFFGGPPNISEVTDLVTGTPVSAGVARGTARVIMNLQEGTRLKQGEILVAPTTAPPWTPLFGIAAAVVTDVGGALSHCGIVAREYGIPCVGGTAIATVKIPDGATIEVDGTAGEVRILS
ncbi:MAG: hypothetical protein HQ478_00015 [Chloroflexi bacterium]|nr:hypothetical protein [Chloroflexota bacterium]